MNDLLDSYHIKDTHYDEYLGEDNKPRSAWRIYSNELKGLDSTELERRQHQIERIVQENGITYNIYGDQREHSHPWVMDQIPMILDHNEFLWIESALTQRVKLFNEVIKDAYADQKLIRDGQIPPYVIFGNPGFQTACYNINAQGLNPIQFYAADIARAPDGRWWVVSDRLDAPSGIGYAMENRFITNRVMPDLFRSSSVLRVQAFFQDLRNSLDSMVQQRKDNPTIVLLTPGPANETYFEQSFLARNLGILFVEGGDLTVRDNKVYLKTLNGMKQVDVIWRRLDSAYCDPLELRKDSLLGIPGLLNSIRQGNVSVVNAVGSGFMESAALKAFLPKLSREIFGEDLLMPSIATWWCGQESEKEYVLENLENLVIKPAFKKARGKTVYGHLLNEKKKKELRDWILKNPEDVCAQELMTRATTPVYHNGKIEPRHFLFRAFLISDPLGNYRLMPGGLTRITDAPDSMAVSMQFGGQSKDTWILAPENSSKIQQDVVLPNTGPVTLLRQMSELPSRVADNIFWMGRYIERTEHQVRLLRLLIERKLEENIEGESFLSCVPFFESLVSPLGFQKFQSNIADNKETSQKTHKLISEYYWDINQSNSLKNTLQSVVRNAFAVKERISVDTWFIISRLQEIEQKKLNGSTNMLSVQLRLNELNEILTFVAGINGMSSENMTRYHDWRLLDLGRRIERLNNILAVVENSLLHKNENERIILNNLLHYADSHYTYRSRYLTNLQPVAVLDLLLADDTNPRSAAFQSSIIRKQLKNLPHKEEENPMNRMEKIALDIYSSIRLVDLNELDSFDAGKRKNLEKFTDEMMDLSHRLSDLLQSLYFAHGKNGEFHY